MTTALDRIARTTWGRYAPPPRLSLAEWADQYRRLPAESSAEPGYWSTARVPYLRAILDAVTDRTIETVVVVKASQTAGTEVLLNTIGYHVHLDPAPILVIEPTLDMASAVSKDRIAPMVRDTPVLRERMATPRARDGQATTFHRTFTGGTLTLAGANSPASLASRPIRVLLCDEVDRWPASLPGEGDPLALALARTLTFQRRKVVIVSSPTVDGGSRIQDWWTLSDQRRYHVECPACRTPFVLDWSAVRWTADDPDSAHVECPACRAVIPGKDRDALVAAGTWVATHPERSGIAGFHVPGVLAPWRSLAEHVRTFLAARHSLEARQAWTNTVKGEWWTPPTEGGSLELGALLLRRESYAAEVPAGVVCLTCGVDVQDDRLAALVVGWGLREESWVLAYETLAGDPARPEVWAALDALLARAWMHATGVPLKILAACLDSGGHRTQAVYQYVMPRQPRRVMATIGRSGGTRGFLVSPPKPMRPASGPGTVLLRTVDTDQAKGLLYSRCRGRLTERSGPEVIHFPMTVGETFFAELTAEVLVTRRNRWGVPVKVWEQRRERNEALDCFVLALAALRVLNPPLETWAAQLAAAAGAPAAPEAPARPPAPAARRTARSAYLQGAGW
jgi:phage terminase large subunit GpA-like protein